MARKPTDTVQLKLRFSERLRRRLEREAKRRGTSLNTAIVDILEEAFRRSDDVIQDRAEVIAEALGDELVSAIATLAAKKFAATEQEIFKDAAKNTEEGSK